jgi:hypothetical protein
MGLGTWLRAMKIVHVHVCLIYEMLTHKNLLKCTASAIQSGNKLIVSQ